MKALAAALGCLTVLPIKGWCAVSESDCGRSWPWFPIVGLLIGGMLLGAHALASTWLPRPLAGTVVLVCWIGLTGALHLDGLADVCDGLYAGRSAEERLRIMKDPHVGAMAVIGLVSVLMVKWAALSGLTSTTALRGLLLAPCLARYGMTVLGTSLPYARSDGGTAAAFVQHAPRGSGMIATMVAVLICGLVAGWIGIRLWLGTLAALAGLRWLFQRQLAGITGDALGAAGELIEALVLLLVSMQRSGVFHVAM